MAREIATTPAGIDGLDLVPGHDPEISESEKDFADAVAHLLNPRSRLALEKRAYVAAELNFGAERTADTARHYTYNLPQVILIEKEVRLTINNLATKGQAAPEISKTHRLKG